MEARKSTTGRVRIPITTRIKTQPTTRQPPTRTTLTTPTPTRLMPKWQLKSATYPIKLSRTANPSTTSTRISSKTPASSTSSSAARPSNSMARQSISSSKSPLGTMKSKNSSSAIAPLLRNRRTQPNKHRRAEGSPASYARASAPRNRKKHPNQHLIITRIIQASPTNKINNSSKLSAEVSQIKRSRTKERHMILMSERKRDQKREKLKANPSNSSQSISLCAC